MNDFHKIRKDFSNGSKIRINFGDSSKGIILGDDIDILYLSEYAFCPKAENLLLSSYPIINKRQHSKIIIASSVNSKDDEFYTQWSKALERRSRFTPVRWHFENVNYFSKEFKEETIKAIGQDRWGTEFECNFNSNTLSQIIGNCPADYFKYFRGEDKKHGYVLYEMINQLKGLNYSQVEEIVNILINIVNEKQKNDIFN